MGKKLFFKSIIILFIIFFSNIINADAFFLNAELENIGSLKEINPACFTNDYNVYEAGFFYFYGMSELNTGYLKTHYNGADYLYGGIISSNNNGILKIHTISPFIKFGRSQSFGFMPVFKFYRYIDDVFLFDYEIRCGSEFRKRPIYSSFLLKGNHRKNISGAFLIGLQSYDYEYIIEFEYSKKLILSGILNFKFNENMNLNFTVDNENRITGSMEFTTLPYKFNYLYYFHPVLGFSTGLIFAYIIPNKNIDFIKHIPYVKKEKIKTVKIEKLLPININTAGVDELALIQGISKNLAKRIILKRIYIGGFKNYSQIDSIYGIGKTLMERIRENTYLEE